ncbi:MAG: thiol-disulfide oxidoreductase DCC family protein [Calditrichia bacterium]
MKKATILFDGVCNLCNNSVTFIIERDPSGYFQFGALQSDEAAELLKKQTGGQSLPDSIVLIDKKGLHTRSTAALRIARHLSGLWPLLYTFSIIPAPIRDIVYNWIAKNRYNWFGKQDSCMLPTPELQQRFLS